MKERVGILGAGNMAEALIRGWTVGALLPKDRIAASDIRVERRASLQDRYGIAVFEENGDLIDWADTVVLAVKPQVLDDALVTVGPRFGSRKLLVSIVAGASTERIARSVAKKTRIVRAMPNTPALVLCGATAIAAGPSATDQDLETARTLFSAVGRVAVVPEGAINAVTGLSGSGPAYLMLVIEALADGGVRAGLARDVALMLAAQTAYGAAQLVLETGDHPAVLKDRVTSPGGTSIAGVHALERAGLRSAFMNAVVEATARADELGRD